MAATTQQAGRVRQIRRELDGEWAAGAVNEAHVARVQAEMRSLPHGHRFPKDPAILQMLDTVGQPQTCQDCGIEAPRPRVAVMRRFVVTKRVTVEYLTEVTTDSKAAARRYAEALGEVNAHESRTVSETWNVTEA